MLYNFATMGRFEGIHNFIDSFLLIPLTNTVYNGICPSRIWTNLILAKIATDMTELTSEFSQPVWSPAGKQSFCLIGIRSVDKMSN